MLKNTVQVKYSINSRFDRPIRYFTVNRFYIICGKNKTYKYIKQIGKKQVFTMKGEFSTNLFK